MNPYREASNILSDLAAQSLTGNAGAYEFLHNASMHCWRIATEQEKAAFNAEFRPAEKSVLVMSRSQA